MLNILPYSHREIVGRLFDGKFICIFFTVTQRFIKIFYLFLTKVYLYLQKTSDLFFIPRKRTQIRQTYNKEFIWQSGPCHCLVIYLEFFLVLPVTLQ